MASPSVSRPWTVLFIGGHSGVGKTTLAHALSVLFHVPVCHVDDIRLVLQRMLEQEKYPDLHMFLQPNIATLYSPAVRCQHLIRIGEIVCSALDVVVSHHLATQTPLILEGDGLLPAFTQQSSYDGVPTNGAVRSVFLLEEHASTLLEMMLSRGRGIGEQDTEKAKPWVELSWHYGQWLAAESQTYQVPVLAAQPWDTLVDRVLDSIGGAHGRSRN